MDGVIKLSKVFIQIVFAAAECEFGNFVDERIFNGKYVNFFGKEGFVDDPGQCEVRVQVHGVPEPIVGFTSESISECCESLGLCPC